MSTDYSYISLATEIDEAPIQVQKLTKIPIEIKILLWDLSRIADISTSRIPVSTVLFPHAPRYVDPWMTRRRKNNSSFALLARFADPPRFSVHGLRGTHFEHPFLLSLMIANLPSRHLEISITKTWPYAEPWPYSFLNSSQFRGPIAFCILLLFQKPSSVP